MIFIGVLYAVLEDDFNFLNFPLGALGIDGIGGLSHYGLFVKPFYYNALIVSFQFTCLQLDIAVIPVII